MALNIQGTQPCSGVGVGWGQTSSPQEREEVRGIEGCSALPPFPDLVKITKNEFGECGQAGWGGVQGPGTGLE